MCYFKPGIAHIYFNILSLSMKKFRSVILLVCVATGLTACKKGTHENFDFAAQFTADTTSIRDFIVKNKIPALKHESGVFYQIIAPGTGSFEYGQNTTVTANYTGRLLGDTASFETTAGKAPVPFTLGGVIAGWQIGVPLVQKGGSIRLFIPSYYGYGNRNTGRIPANSVLDFDIEVVDLK